MIGEYVGIVSLVLVNVGASLGVYKYFNGRLERVYTRLDEVRENIDTDFVHKNLCDVMHKGTACNLEGMEKRMEVRIDKMEIKIEKMFTDITSMLRK